VIALVEPVLDAIALVDHRAQALGVALELSCEGRAEDAAARARSLPSVLGEPNELAQAVLNLLVNALDALEAAPKGTGRIRVDLRRSPDGVALSVADNGPGVSEEDLPRIRTPSHDEGGREGHGLGLAIVHNVAASHGGRVELFSRRGGGSAEIRLPAGSSTR
jgi:signal transduction histidine kinase